MWAALGVVKVIHEFGHGLSCKAFGGEVHEMGFLFLCFSPAMYRRRSRRRKNRDRRQAVTVAGEIRRRLAALAPARLELLDESDKHIGHAGARPAATRTGN
jgi:hypothetical protein